MPPGDRNRSGDRVHHSQQVSAATESGVNPKSPQLLDANWLELWYQPKIDSEALSINGAEALLRMRHPHMGLVLPAHFIPDDGDPRFQALSQLVIDQAIADWHDWFAQELRVDISINLPVSFLRDPACLEYLYRRLPDQAAFDGIIVEINGTAVTRRLPLVQDLAKQMRFRKVGISIDDLGMEWPDLAGLDDFPFVEIKVDRALVGGCAQDRRKRGLCGQIIDLANHYGARTVAKAHGRAAIHAHNDAAAGGNAAGRSAVDYGERRVSLGGGRSCRVTTFICQPPDQDFQDPIGNDLRDVSEAHARAMLLADRVMMFSGFADQALDFRRWTVRVTDASQNLLMTVLFPVHFPRGKWKFDAAEGARPLILDLDSILTANMPALPPAKRAGTGLLQSGRP